MADYRDLLRRAIEALPENNGNARRQVYDKARAALRKQLDAIQPDLPSREKTHHRLQLEECIREVEQEATERMLSGLSRLEQDNFGAGSGHSHATDVDPEDESDAIDSSESDSESPSFAPPHDEAGEPEPAPEPPAAPIPRPRPAFSFRPAPPPEAPPEAAKPVDSTAVPPRPRYEIKRVAIDPVAVRPAPVRVEAHSLRTATVESPAPVSLQPPGVAPVAPTVAAVASTLAALHEHAVVSVEPARQTSMESPAVAAPPPANPDPAPSRFSSRVSALLPGMGNGQQAKAQRAEPAMSTEREVEVDTGVADPQTAIDHAIAILDREASGSAALGEANLETADPDMADLAFAKAEAEDEGGSPALLILLVIMVSLFAAGLGGGWWLWREGYLDGKMFGIGDAQTISDTVTTGQAAPTVTPATEPVRQIGEEPDASSGTEVVEATRPGNTIATPGVVETPAAGLQPADGDSANTMTDNALALAPTGDAAVTDPSAGASDTGGGVGNTMSESSRAADAAATIAEPTPGDDKTEDRLPVADAGTGEPAAAMDQPAGSAEEAAEGSQSLLLEASDQTNAGAVPYSGTVEWTRGVDELGQPTLQATANIPARNMSVTVLLRKNSDASLPASHLIEIDFTVSDGFIGGGISRIAGILMKNEELVQGVPLVGASARIVGNTFLFALSATKEDISSNNELLKSRKWMDLAVIYSTGKQAILTLEKDAAATALFDEVLGVWNPDAPVAATPPQ